MSNVTLNEAMGLRTRRARRADVGGGWPLPDALMGVEVEIEQQQVTTAQSVIIQQNWVTHVDTSLRDGIEYVFDGPKAGSVLSAALAGFFDSGIRYSMSERTSVHVHINMTDDVTISQFRAFFCLMYMLEPAVFRLADENRKWCSYCCPLTDMGVNRLVGILTGDQNTFVRELKGQRHQDKYYGFNTASLAKHGTVEFRYFPCTADKDVVISWVKLVQECKKFAMTVGSANDIVNAFSDRARIGAVLEAQMPESADQLIRNLDLDDCAFRAGELERLLHTDVEETSIYKAPAVRHGLAYRKMMKKKFGIDVATPSRNPTRKYTQADFFVAIREGNYTRAHQVASGLRQQREDVYFAVDDAPFR